MHTQLNIVGLDRAELAQVLTALNLPDKEVKMRVNQIWSAIYNHKQTSFVDITTLSKDLRSRLSTVLTLARPKIITEQKSIDGTRKWLLRIASARVDVPGPEIEMVYIPEDDRGTLCISSQVGCALTCTFCHTGTQKFVRNLTTGEIISQILIAYDALNASSVSSQNFSNGPITNIVMMGMGEPLYNFDNVRDALNIVSDRDGLSLSKRRITLSTSGVVPMIERAGKEIGSMLAISLHGVTNDVRDKLVPLNKKYPIEVLLKACRNYPGISNSRRITFEYVMLEGINDSLSDAKALTSLLSGIPAKINLIPFNPWPGSPYKCSNWITISKFADVVNRAGYVSTIRKPRGRDIMAACGQLKSDTIKIRTN